MSRRNRTLQRLLMLTVLGLGLMVVLSRDGPLMVAHAARLDGPKPHKAGVQISLVGKITDSQGEPIDGAEITLVINGTPVAHQDGHGLAESQLDGTFLLDVPPELAGSIETLTLEISRSHFSSLAWQADGEDIARLNEGASLRLPDVELPRRVTAGFWIAALTFAAILVVIALERLHNTLAALLGAAIILGVSFVGGAINANLLNSLSFT